MLYQLPLALTLDRFLGKLKAIHCSIAFSTPTQVWPAAQGFAYDQLKGVINSFEVDRVKKGDSPFPSFDKDMQLLDRGRRGVEWAWVRTRNTDQFVSS